MKNSNIRTFIMFLLFAMCHVSFSFAGIMAETTRLIFPQGMTERSLMIANANNYPILVQAWVDNGDVNNVPEKTISPFIVLPAVFQMSPQGVLGLRIVFKNQKLPEDKESVFWLNMYEMPPTKKAASVNDAELVVAMNTQMKIFYRPQALLKKPKNIQEKLHFSLSKQGSSWVLSCNNISGYYASFSAIKLIVDGKDYNPESKLDMMVAPFSTGQFTFNNIEDIRIGQKVDVEFMLISDTGVSEKETRTHIY